ncbi:STAS domain-containing protein [Maribellus sp. CM-23]|uniref:STAS domain-containing protein n=1 Tax=Maribellus sp. CM-23 TaxID=2781026 RepID=UPI001F15B435|nr:STAS domain-containing protein [Maribellus sp. CM-23]MCE4564887.1 STAS domain-containing protein [Maribellus sp. CM-23]
MTFDIQKCGSYTLVKVNADRLDTNNAPDLKSELVLVNNEGEKNIVLDLSNVTYCDSSGLRAVLVANRLCEDAIGTFILCGLQPDVENLVKISMLHTVLLITDTAEEAERLLEKKDNL